MLTSGLLRISSQCCMLLLCSVVLLVICYVLFFQQFCLFASLRTCPFGTGGTFQVRILEGRGGIWHVCV